MADDTTLDELKFYREEVKHEFNLIAHRLSWYVTCQSFLLTTFAIAKGNTVDGNWFTGFLLPSLGAVLSILAFFPIRFAANVIDEWLAKQDTLLIANDDLKGFRIKRPGHIHWVSMWLPQLLPVVFVVTWVVIFFAVRSLS